jgi:peptidoglycan-associated lipoprotein
MFSKRQIRFICFFAILTALFLVGCKKKAPPPPPPAPPKVETPKPPPPPPPKSAAITQFAAEPSSIERGQSATLRWSVSDASEISIDNGIGTVQANGSRQVFPSNSTTYTLTARGADGRSVTATASVNVTAPPPPPPPPPKVTRSITERLSGDVADVFFDYDKSDIREDARNTLTRNADAIKSILNDFSGESIVIEGHCDERGSAEYNLGLGDRRATAVKEFLSQLGVPADRLRTISYGKERPVCTEGNEDCWQRNRRAHFAAGQ